jgi:radical SAM superfamily enzyme YgiQ (UPF0313 family)
MVSTPKLAATASARVLLVNSNRYDQPYPVYPLGLAYIDGALRAAGYETRIWDSLGNAQSLESFVSEFQPDFVGLSLRNIDTVQCLNPHSFVPEMVDCCRRLRAMTAAPLILGGSGFSIFPRELFTLAGVDYGIAGEGEQSLVALLAALRAGAALDAIPGLVFRKSDGSVSATPYQLSRRFEGSPFHDPKLLQAYAQHGSLPGIQTQRGCPLKCCYCTYPVIEGRRSRFRSGEEIVAELRQLSAKGIRYAFFVDSVFNTRIDHVVETCEAILRSGLDMQWECFLRPGDITRELLQLMQRSGLRHIEFGSDSFSDATLASYGKSFTFEDIRNASELAHSAGVQYSHFLIFGGPGETEATIEETLARAVTLPAAFFFATIGMRIYPDTDLWKQLAPEKNGESGTDYLVDPRFYIAPGLTAENLHGRLKALQRTASNWIVGDPPVAFSETMTKLRQRGVRGPMREYVDLLQRLSMPPRSRT